MDIRVSELVPAAAQRPPDSEPFFRESQREYVGVSAREGREGGRKGINISESRSLRRKLEEPDDNVTFVRSLVPSFSIIFRESLSGWRTAQEGPVGKDRTKKAVKTNALSAWLPPAYRPLHSIPLWRLEMDDPSSIIPSRPPSTEPNFFSAAAAI